MNKTFFGINNKIINLKFYKTEIKMFPIIIIKNNIIQSVLNRLNWIKFFLELTINHKLNGIKIKNVWHSYR